MLCSLRDTGSARPFGQKFALANAGDAEDGRAADDAERTSAHIGRSGKPKRRRWRRPLTSRAMIATQPTMPRTQVSVPPMRALRAAADELERRVEAGHGRAAGQVPDEAADRQQAAEGDDERRARRCRR